MAHKNKLQNPQRFSQSIVSALLTEIIVEILLKLPVESLLRCKSVCKEWYSLISDKHFIKTHYSLSSTNTNFAHLVFISESRKLKSCPLNDILFDNSLNTVLEHPIKRSTCILSGIRIVGSCNGLLCIRFEGTIFIYNPSTRISNRLYFRFKDRYSKVFGFGYDDYKLVAINFENKVKIYSLKTGKWKNLSYFPIDYDHDLLRESLTFQVPTGICSNGALHWVEEIDQNSGDSNQWKIHSLDLAKETFDEVLQPEYDEGGMELELGAIGKWLCVLCNYPKSRADLWVMKVYGVKDSWTKLASIPFGPLMDRYMYNSYLEFSNPLCQGD